MRVPFSKTQLVTVLHFETIVDNIISKHIEPLISLCHTRIVFPCRKALNLCKKPLFVKTSMSLVMIVFRHAHVLTGYIECAQCHSHVELHTCTSVYMYVGLHVHVYGTVYVQHERFYDMGEQRCCCCFCSAESLRSKELKP